eukprot:557304-Pleurochrysis_carterae.AAC.3
MRICRDKSRFATSWQIPAEPTCMYHHRHVLVSRPHLPSGGGRDANAVEAAAVVAQLKRAAAHAYGEALTRSQGPDAASPLASSRDLL